MGDIKKVLFVTHQLAMNIYGGAETQILNYAKYLDKKTVKVQLMNMWRDHIEDYNILHIFHLRSFPIESLEIVKYAINHGVKVVVSPIYWRGNRNIRNKLFAFSRSISFKLGQPESICCPRRLLESADLILPNTLEEERLVRNFFMLKHNRFKIIPNGVDSSFKLGDPELFVRKYGIQDFVLFVGRIEPRKNVLSLIKAFKRANIKTKLVIIGKLVDKRYFNSCLKYANNDVMFLPSLPHNSEMLKAAYKAAKVVVLPSLYETPGLVALEAGLAGANIAVTKVGGTEEYFGKHAWYINPDDEKSLLDSIFKAYLAPKSVQLSKHIEENFTWCNVGKQLEKIYNSL
jgi:glycosyltransferase involved in cell wall biosynthesis